MGNPKICTEFHPAERLPGALIEIRGRKVIDFTSWDALDWGSSKESERALAKAAALPQSFLSSARLVSGTSLEQLQLEQDIAKYIDCNQAVSFSSRGQAVLSFCTIWLREGDLVFYDELSQSPIVDGAYLVGARPIPYSALAIDSLARELSQLSSGPQRRFIFCESVSPISGVAVNSIQLRQLAAKSQATLCIDESYAFARVGLAGRGLFERQAEDNLQTEEVKFVDLGVALGCFGAVLGGPADVISTVVGNSRALASEAALPPIVARMAAAAFLYMQGAMTKRERLRAAADLLRVRCKAAGARVDMNAVAPIVSLEFDRLSVAAEFCNALFERGFFLEALPVRAPFSERAVARILLRTEHSTVQLAQLAQVIGEVLPRLEYPAR